MTDYLDNGGKKIKLALQLVSGYASEFQSWRLPESYEKAYTDIDFYVQMAKTAEQGKIHTLFIADTPSFGGAGGGTDISTRSPAFPLEPMVMLSAVAYATQKIGLVATFSTTYNLPYNLARQLKTLDTLSKGRVGWNAVTTSTAFTAYNFGDKPLPDTTTRYEMAFEMVEAVQTLWGTFGENAYIADKATGQFADMSQIRQVLPSQRGIAPFQQHHKDNRPFFRQVQVQKAWS
ncbi:LLM class flavin-dependent oxidoreductase [Mannheimia granulomatis]|uniref:LLM class flavin-dependent oxidoreductase n=1 Tax=Mannheimia granulomatis TaxID=85402 RepID=UPI0004AF2895|nr:LLM class flavin-dependent oxidoreductase [Mannheimia granulomatis]